MGRFVVDTAALAALESHAPIDRAVHDLATDIFDEAQGRVPVDTGYLRSTGFVDGADSEYRIGYEADYAKYVEFGTSEMDAQPYLTPSALRDRGEL